MTKELRLRWCVAIAVAVAAAINACGLAVAVRPPGRWEDRLEGRLRPDALRADCDGLMAAPTAHATYWRPQGDGVGAGAPPLTFLPRTVQDLQPDRVTVDAAGVSLSWRGEIMTEHLLFVLSDDRDPTSDDGRHTWARRGGARQLAPRIWAYVE